MDISTIDTSVPRARQLRDEPQSGRYQTREYQQRQPSLERGAADQTDLIAASLRGRRRYLPGDRPDEPRELARNRGRHLGFRFPARDQLPKA